MFFSYIYARALHELTFRTLLLIPFKLIYRWQKMKKNQIGAEWRVTGPVNQEKALFFTDSGFLAGLQSSAVWSQSWGWAGTSSYWIWFTIWHEFHLREALGWKLHLHQLELMFSSAPSAFWKIPFLFHTWEARGGKLTPLLLNESQKCHTFCANLCLLQGPVQGLLATFINLKRNAFPQCTGHTVSWNLSPAQSRGVAYRLWVHLNSTFYLVPCRFTKKYIFPEERKDKCSQLFSDTAASLSFHTNGSLAFCMMPSYK